MYKIFQNDKNIHNVFWYCFLKKLGLHVYFQYWKNLFDKENNINILLIPKSNDKSDVFGILEIEVAFGIQNEDEK